MYRNVMVDNETMGKRPGSLVLSIGLCAFDHEAHVFGKTPVGPSLHLVLDRGEQHSRIVDPATQLWWSEQSEEARRAWESAPQVPVRAALGQFAAWLMANTIGTEKVLLWGNGSDFDISMLCDLHHWAGVPITWNQHRNHRCFRTLKEMHRADYDRACQLVPRQGLHNAEADAVWQASIAWRILRRQQHLEAVGEGARALLDGGGKLSCVYNGPEREELEECLGLWENTNVPRYQP